MSDLLRQCGQLVVLKIQCPETGQLVGVSRQLSQVTGVRSSVPVRSLSQLESAKSHLFVPAMTCPPLGGNKHRPHYAEAHTGRKGWATDPVPKACSIQLTGGCVGRAESRCWGSGRPTVQDFLDDRSCDEGNRRSIRHMRVLIRKCNV